MIQTKHEIQGNQVQNTYNIYMLIHRNQPSFIFSTVEIPRLTEREGRGSTSLISLYS